MQAEMRIRIRARSHANSVFTRLLHAYSEVHARLNSIHARLKGIHCRHNQLHYIRFPFVKNTRAHDRTCNGSKQSQVQ